MSIDVSDVMDDLGTALATISGLEVFDFPPDMAAKPPFAYVDVPSQIGYDYTKGGTAGRDRAIFPVLVAVGRASDRAARDQISAFCAGFGASSVRAALFSSGLRRVGIGVPVYLDLAGGPFLAYRFDVTVTS